MQKRIMIEATLALSRSLGSIESTVDSTTDKALRASWYFVKDYPLGSSLGVYGEFTCTPGISGKMK